MNMLSSLRTVMCQPEPTKTLADNMAAVQSLSSVDGSHFFRDMSWCNELEQLYFSSRDDILVIGARQVGKTTACMSIILEELKSTHPTDIVVVCHSRQMATYVSRQTSAACKKMEIALKVSNANTIMNTPGVRVTFTCKSSLQHALRGRRVDLLLIDCDIDEEIDYPNPMCRIIEFRDCYHQYKTASIVVDWLQGHYTHNVTGYHLKQLKKDMIDHLGERNFEIMYELR